MSITYLHHQDQQNTAQLSAILKPVLAHASQVWIITDENVAQYHLASLKTALAGFNPKEIIIPAGEHFKSRKTKAQIEKELLRYHADRQTMLIALGGGVVTDLTGFVAATYMRGIRYINIPTSLLAMVDASVGGKTGINTPEGKNLIGAYWSPEKVIIDTRYLSTLPQVYLTEGLIETLKMMLVCDAEAVEQFEQYFAEGWIPTFTGITWGNAAPVGMAPENFSSVHTLAEKGVLPGIPLLHWLVGKSIAIKSSITEQDPRESGLRKILNFGHTVGHAIEQVSNYQIPHGIAVGYGILVESWLAFLMRSSGQAGGRHETSKECVGAEPCLRRIETLLAKLGIYGKDLAKFDTMHLIKAMYSDKKNQSNQIHCVLLKAIGEVDQSNNQYAHPIDAAIIQEAIEIIKQEK